MKRRAQARSLPLLALAWIACGAPVGIPSVNYEGMESQVAEQIEHSRRSVSSEPTSAAAWGALGMSLHAHDLFSEAGECYRRAAEGKLVQ